MKMFRKALVMLLLMALAVTLLPAAGLAESDLELDPESESEEPEETGFDALRKLMEEPLSENIPAAEGKTQYADITVAQNNQAGTPDGILCQLLFNENRIINSGVTKVKKDGTEEYEDKYTAVTYSDLTAEQMLYYAYVISTNFNTVQDMMPYGTSFSIVIKFGGGPEDLLLINDAELAATFTEKIVNLVATLSGTASAE